MGDAEPEEEAFQMSRLDLSSPMDASYSAGQRFPTAPIMRGE